MVLDAVLKISSQVDSALRGIDQLTDSVNRLGQLELGRSLTDMGDRLTNMVTEPIVGGLESAFSNAVEFESAMAGVNKVLGDDIPENFGRQLRDMSHDIPIAATGLAEIAAAGGRLGVGGDDILEFTELTSQMAVAFDMAAGSAGDSIARMQTVLGLETLDQVRQAADMFNELDNNAGVAANQLVDVATRTGGIARTFGLSTPEIAALSTAFIKMAPSPEIAATAINSFLPALQTATNQTPKFQAALESIGISANDMVTMIERDAMGGIQNFLDLLGQLDSTARANVIRDMFGSGSDAALISTLAEETDILANNLAIVSDEASIVGSMLREAETQAGTTGSQLQLTQNRLADLSTEVGESLTPAVNKLLDAIDPLIEKMINFAESHPGITAGLIGIAAAAAIAGPALTLLGSSLTAVSTIAALFGAGGAFAAAGPALAKVLGFLGKLALALAKAAAFIVLVAGLPFLIFNIGSKLQGVEVTWEETFGVIQDSLMALPERLSQIPSAVSGAFSALVNIARLKFNEMKIAIFTKLGEITTNALTKAGEIVNNISTGISNGIGAVTDTVNRIKTTIIETISGIAGQMFDKGSEIVNRLAEGISSAFGFLRQTVSSLGGIVGGGVPGSPVQYGPLTALNSMATNPGAKIVDMLAAGITSRASSLQGVLSSAISPALDSGNPFSSSLSPGLSTQNTGSTFNAGGVTVNVTVTAGADGTQTAQDIGNELRRILPDVLDSVMGDRQRVGYVG